MMNYSAGMVSQVFAFVEAKKLADLLSKGLTKDEAWEKVETENLFQLRNATRLRRTLANSRTTVLNLPSTPVLSRPATSPGR